MRRNLKQAVGFARFCQREAVDPQLLALFLDKSRRLMLCEVRAANLNMTSEQYVQNENRMARLRGQCNELAIQMRFQVCFGNPIPGLKTASGRYLMLPEM